MLPELKGPAVIAELILLVRKLLDMREASLERACEHRWPRATTGRSQHLHRLRRLSPLGNDRGLRSWRYLVSFFFDLI